jgi:hypothetical protein
MEGIQKVRPGALVKEVRLDADGTEGAKSENTAHPATSAK